MFVCDFIVKYQFLSFIVQHLLGMLEFTTVEKLDIDEFPDLCHELAGPFESRFLLPI